MAFLGTGFGAVAMAWVEMNTKLEWRWIQWISLIIGATVTAIMALTMKETRCKSTTQNSRPSSLS